MLHLAGRMLLEKHSRLLLVVLAVSGAFFLALTQLGVLLGWIQTTGALIRRSGADIWVMAPHTPVYEYAGPIPERLVERARSVPGVVEATALFVGWSVWRLRDGSFKGTHIVGLDDTCRGGPWEMESGQLSSVHEPYGVVVDRVYAQAMGVERVGDECTIYGRRARILGFSRGVRTFTAAPYVFSGLDEAKRYDGRFREDEITYVLVNVAPGADVERVRSAIAEACPTAEVLTTEAFARRTNSYWLIQTGAGLTLCLSIGLAIFISVTVLGQAMYAIPSHIVEKALLLYALLTASDTPAWVRALVLAALAYLINPLDAVPDVLPGIGLTDDFAVLALALERASRYITPAVRKRARALAPKWLGK